MKKKRRDWGTGRIFRPKRCRFWYVQYRDADGKRRTESTRSEKRSDAQRLLRDRLGRRDRGELSDLHDVRRVTFAHLVDLIERDYVTKRRSSLPRLKTSLAHLRSYFRSFRAVDITRRHLVRYVEMRQREGAADASIGQELAALKRAFNLAIRGRELTQKPDFGDLVTVENARQGFFEADDLTAVLRELPEYLRPVIEFAHLTGWRKGEVLNLTWAQVDFGAGIVRLEPGTTKNKEGRVFPFDVLPPLADLLQRQRAVTTALEKKRGAIIRWVFHRNGNRILYPYTAWRRACDRAGCPGKIMHDLRRTAVRNLERAGVPRSVAMKLTGHKTEAVYRRYAIVAEGDLREGVAKLAGVGRDQTTSQFKQRPGM